MCDTGMRVLLWRARSKYRCGLGGGCSVTLSGETLTENRYQLNPAREQALQMSG